MTTQYYLYAITNHSITLPTDLQGLYAQPLLIQNIAGINVLYSLYPEAEFLPVPSIRQNLLKHQQTVETLYAQANILPMKFGTVQTLEQMKTLLAEKASEFQASLLYFEDKTEVVIKGFWNDMTPVYAEILQRTPAVAEFRNKISSGMIPNTQNNLIEVGQMVANALAQHKVYIQNLYLQAFSKITVAVLPQETSHDTLFLNIALLIPKGQVSTFETTLNNLPTSQDKNVKIKYFGAAPPNHFL